MRTSTLKVISLILCIAAISCRSGDEPLPDSPETMGKGTTEITLEEARADLESLLLDLDNPASRSGMSPRRIKNAFTRNVAKRLSRSGEADSVQIHIFNFADEQGFAIMSGDERIPSLIALAESGSITNETVITNPGMAIFLDGMENQINGLGYGDGFVTPTDSIVIPGFGGGSGGRPTIIYGEWSNHVYVQNGLCPVKWGQEDPFNKYCPLVNGQRPYSGCVATAVAQLMAIHEWPTAYNGFVFPWDEMIVHENIRYCSTRAKDAVARLMQQLGVGKNLNVTYGLDASSAPSENIMRTLNAFGYTNPGSLKDYDVEEIASEIRGGHGVLISGTTRNRTTISLGINVDISSANDVSAHQWLIHGMMERRRTNRYFYNGKYVSSKTEIKYYPLCNWGWESDIIDGYYLSNAFNTNQGPSYPDSFSVSRIASGNSGYEDGNYQSQLRIVSGIRQ